MTLREKNAYRKGYLVGKKVAIKESKRKFFEDEDDDFTVADFVVGRAKLGKIPVFPLFRSSNGEDEWTGPGYPPFSKLNFDSPVGKLVIRDHLADGGDEIYASLNGEDLSVIGLGEEVTAFANDDYVVFYTVSCRGDFVTYTVIYDKAAIPAEILEKIKNGKF